MLWQVMIAGLRHERSAEPGMGEDAYSSTDLLMYSYAHLVPPTYIQIDQHLRE